MAMMLVLGLPLPLRSWAESLLAGRLPHALFPRKGVLGPLVGGGGLLLCACLELGVVDPLDGAVQLGVVPPTLPPVAALPPGLSLGGGRTAIQ